MWVKWIVLQYVGEPYSISWRNRKTNLLPSRKEFSSDYLSTSSAISTPPTFWPSNRNFVSAKVPCTTSPPCSLCNCVTRFTITSLSISLSAVGSVSLENPGRMLYPHGLQRPCLGRVWLSHCVLRQHQWGRRSWHCTHGTAEEIVLPTVLHRPSWWEHCLYSVVLKYMLARKDCFYPILVNIWTPPSTALCWQTQPFGLLSHVLEIIYWNLWTKSKRWMKD